MSELETLREDFPVVIEVPVSWGEMDALGHVNNIIYFRYFESARIAYFERIEFLEEMNRSGIGPILASTKCRFRRALTYPDRIHIGARARELQEDRFNMHYRVVSEEHGKSAAEGEGLIVAYNYREKQKARLPESIRAAINELEPPE